MELSTKKQFYLVKNGKVSDMSWHVTSNITKKFKAYDML